jgi:hypothetical protein
MGITLGRPPAGFTPEQQRWLAALLKNLESAGSADLAAHVAAADPHTGYVLDAALASYVQNTRLISAGSGLTGGGSLAADRTLALTGSPLALFNLAAAAGWLRNDGAGVLSYSTPTKSDVGLGNVDNTSDLSKPVSTATQTALDAKVPTTRTVNSQALSADIIIPGWEVIEDYTVSGGAITNLTFSGLDGDTDELYKVLIFAIANGTLAGMDMRPNADATANNYRYQYLQASNNATTPGRADYSNGLILGNANTSGDLLLTEATFYAKSGWRRVCRAHANSNVNATTLDIVEWTTYWKDTATNITSLLFEPTGGLNVIANGSRFILARREAL